ncbi:Transcriptional activator protein Anr [Ralstonia psammae]|uniref:Transcriptional activator protein Anr n=1 Tax=Ralstonia psammae TaxID=3058598 RepID=A0ABN9JIV5_9RALS|nr:Crp/Fnr family transcriptional regulator [Ralstonia sp. LMG 19083]CAJ0809730.1 Transcriptional activator protein Anr [Ralstonia sp. LMG 19083]
MPDHSTTTTCTACENAGHCLLEGLAHGDIAIIEDLAQRAIRVPRGETLFRAGDAVDGLFAVKSGSLKITLGDEHGRESIVAFCLSGDVFGTDGLESATRTTSAIALEDTEVYAIPWGHLATVAEQSLAIQKVMKRVFSMRIHRK